MYPYTCILKAFDIVRPFFNFKLFFTFYLPYFFYFSIFFSHFGPLCIIFQCYIRSHTQLLLIFPVHPVFGVDSCHFNHDFPVIFCLSFFHHEIMFWIVNQAKATYPLIPPRSAASVAFLVFQILNFLFICFHRFSTVELLPVFTFLSPVVTFNASVFGAFFITSS